MGSPHTEVGKGVVSERHNKSYKRGMCARKRVSTGGGDGGLCTRNPDYAAFEISRWGAFYHQIDVGAQSKGMNKAAQLTRS